MKRAKCPKCKGSGTRFEMRLNSCGHFPCPVCKGKGRIKLPVKARAASDGKEQGTPRQLPESSPSPSEANAQTMEGENCVLRIEGGEKPFVIYLRDGRKISVGRTADTHGPAWLKLEQTPIVRALSSSTIKEQPEKESSHGR